MPLDIYRLSFLVSSATAAVCLLPNVMFVLIVGGVKSLRNLRELRSHNAICVSSILFLIGSLHYEIYGVLCRMTEWQEHDMCNQNGPKFFKLRTGSYLMAMPLYYFGAFRLALTLERLYAMVKAADYFERGDEISKRFFRIAAAVATITSLWLFLSIEPWKPLSTEIRRKRTAWDNIRGLFTFSTFFLPELTNIISAVVLSLKLKKHELADANKHQKRQHWLSSMVVRDAQYNVLFIALPLLLAMMVYGLVAYGYIEYMIRTALVRILLSPVLLRSVSVPMTAFTRHPEMTAWIRGKLRPNKSVRIVPLQ